VLSADVLGHVPSKLSFEKTATLPCAAVTAFVAPTGHRRVIAVAERTRAGPHHDLLAPGRGSSLDRNTMPSTLPKR